MYKSKRICMAIPCLDEEDFIGPTLEAVPDFIDRIFVVDDGSTDGTLGVIRNVAKKDHRIVPIVHAKNMGNGYSVTSVMKRAIEEEFDINIIVAGDNQCRQEYLTDLVEEVAEDNCDYAKANRFTSARELRQMPRFRKIGNIAMSFMNKFATGYYSVFDPLNSYSATKVAVLRQLDLDAISHRYDFEISYMFHLYLANARIKDVPVPAKYAGEISGIKLSSYIPRASRTLFVSFISRIYFKYFLFSLHPVALFLVSGLVLFLFGSGYGLVILTHSLVHGHVPATTATVMLAVVPFIVGFQLLLNALVLDIQNEPKPR